MLFNRAEVQKAAEIEFTNAFNKQRVVLAGFAKCNSKEELHIVRDGFYLGMCRHLGLPLYKDVKDVIIKDMKVAAASGTPGSFEQTIKSARSAPAFNKMIESLFENAKLVNSDLQSIWLTLENGRLEWLEAIKATHTLKINLKKQLEADKGSTARDVIDAIQVWCYGLCLGNPKTRHIAEMWGRAAKIEVAQEPLKGYQQELWDPRRKEWAPGTYEILHAYTIHT
eukprot:g7719.t1